LSVWCGAEGCVSGLRAAARKPTMHDKIEHQIQAIKLLLLHLVGHLYNSPNKFLYEFWLARPESGLTRARRGMSSVSFHIFVTQG
jgi:hypothetical protein